MSQQINLFNPALRPKKDWLTLSNVVLAAALMLAALMVVGSWGRYKEGLELARFKSQEAQLKATQAQLVELASLQANRRTDPLLEKEVADKKLLINQKQQVLALLEDGEVGNRAGFAMFMTALARQTPEGVWLTGFDIQSGGKSIRLQGGLINEPALPLFVQHLNQEPEFKGRHFAALQVSPVPPVAAPQAGTDERDFLARSGYLQFSLEGVGVSAPAQGGVQ